MLTCELMKVHVVTAPADETVRYILDLMDLHRVRSVPIVDQRGHVVGIVAECDVRRVLGGGQETPSLSSAATARLAERSATVIRDMMSSPVMCARDQSDAEEPAQILASGELWMTPVVDDRGALVGSVTRLDLWQAMLDAAR